MQGVLLSICSGGFILYRTQLPPSSAESGNRVEAALDVRQAPHDYATVR